MKLAHRSNCRGEGLGIWIIVLAILAGAVWFVVSSKTDTDKSGHAFAVEVGRRLAVDYDEKFLVSHLNPENQATRLPAWRDRLFKNLRSFGPLTKPVETSGDIVFTSKFFDPHGTFRSDLSYAAMPAHFDFSTSKGQNGWRIDELNLVWNPPPPPPSPTPAMSPTPTPSPTPEPRKKKRG
jgi:hypothetical protein